MDLLQGRIVRAGVKTDGWYLQTCFLWPQQLLLTYGITGAATSAVSRGTHLVWSECPHALGTVDSFRSSSRAPKCTPHRGIGIASPVGSAELIRIQRDKDRLRIPLYKVDEGPHGTIRELGLFSEDTMIFYESV